MEKIYLKRISERLNEKELKNVVGGRVYDSDTCNTAAFCTTVADCEGGCQGCHEMDNWPGKTCTTYK